MLGCRLRSCSDDRGRCEMRLTGAICGKWPFFAKENGNLSKEKGTCENKRHLSEVKRGRGTFTN